MLFATAAGWNQGRLISSMSKWQSKLILLRQAEQEDCFQKQSKKSRIEEVSSGARPVRLNKKDKIYTINIEQHKIGGSNLELWFEKSLTLGIRFWLQSQANLCTKYRLWQLKNLTCCRKLSSRKGRVEKRRNKVTLLGIPEKATDELLNCVFWDWKWWKLVRRKVGFLEGEVDSCSSQGRRIIREFGA